VVAPVENIPHCAGRASLEVQLVSGESAVTSSYATNPLKLLTPHARGQSVWAYTSSFGGGLVAGDQTRLDLHVGQGARCFLATQASTKIYRNTTALPSGHETRATLDAGSLLVFAPDPVQPFAGSSYTQRQEFRLAQDASLVLLDWFGSGRAARGERWSFNHFASRNAVWLAPSLLNGVRDETARMVPGSAELSPNNADLVFLDSLLLDPEDSPLDAPHRTGRFNCFATLLLLGPAVSELAQAMLADIGQRPVSRQAPLLFAVSPVRDGAVLRLAGERVEDITRELRQRLSPLSASLGDNPWARKW
jgi:urease accessory protein